MLKNWVKSLEKNFFKTTKWFSFLKKLLSRIRSKLGGTIKLLIALILKELKQIINSKGDISLANMLNLVGVFFF